MSDSGTSVTRQTLAGAAWLVSWRMLTRSIGVVSTLVLARLLVTSDFGLIAMATTFSAGVEALSQLGLQDALVRRRTEGMELHNTAFTLQLGRAVITACVIAAGAPAASWWFDEPRLVPVLLILAGTTVVGGFENVGLAEYRRAMQFNVQFRLMLVRRLVSFAVTVMFALLFRSYIALLAGIAAGTVIWVSMSYAMHPFRPRLSLGRWRELAHFSGWTWAATLAGLVWERCDPFVLGPAFGTAQLGLYLLAMEIALLPVTELIAPTADALFSGFARLQRGGTSSLHVTLDVIGIILLLILPIVLAISAAAGPVVEVMLGSKWVEAWPVVSVLTWTCVFSPFSFVASSALVANGFVSQNFWAKIIVSVGRLAMLTSVVSFTTDIVLIGISSVTIAAIEGIVYFIFLTRVMHLRLRPLFGSLSRAALALASAAWAVTVLSYAWQSGAGTVLEDLIRGVSLGMVAATTFWAVTLTTWLLLGRPEGPEARAMGLLSDAAGQLRRTLTFR